MKDDESRCCPGLYESQMRTCGVRSEASVEGQRTALMHNIVQRNVRLDATPMACRAFNPVGVAVACATSLGRRLVGYRPRRRGECVSQITIFAWFGSQFGVYRDSRKSAGKAQLTCGNYFAIASWSARYLTEISVFRRWRMRSGLVRSSIARNG